MVGALMLIVMLSACTAPKYVGSIRTDRGKYKVYSNDPDTFLSEFDFTVSNLRFSNHTIKGFSLKAKNINE